MLTRRQFVKAGMVAGAGVLVPTAVGARTALAAVPGGTLDPSTIAKYVTPLFVMPEMPSVGTVAGGIERYVIAARQFRQQILPAGMPGTAVYGYGSVTSSATFHSPSWTIEATANHPARVNWVNQLTRNGRFLPPLLPVDPTLHWANPPGGASGRDMRPVFTKTPGPYRGPVPIVTHLHGGHSQEEADGYPEAWYLPACSDVPAGFATVGTFYERFRAKFARHTGHGWDRGAAEFEFTNDQRATTLWFHDHTLGMTRVNFYTGLTGMYMIRGGSADLPAGVLPGPAPKTGEAAGTRHYEIPLMIQDKSFNKDGSLFFPDSRGFFGDVPPGGPFVPDTDVPPIWNPEFFGNSMLVNGNTWPTLSVEPRRYRFRMVNACNTRFVMLKIVTNPTADRPAPAALPLWLIGTDGGFLPRPVRLDRLTAAPAERSDVIVDFTGLPVGTQLYLINEGPDEPFGGGEPGTDFDPADPATTGQVMKFVVRPLVGHDRSVPPDQLHLPKFTPIGGVTNSRRVSLNELDSVRFPDAPIIGLLGTVNADGTANPLHWMDAVTENPAVGANELWELHNYTEDGHPIHIHQTQFQVVNRQPFGNGPVRPPDERESGFKDTVIALPNEITRVKARFDIPGRYVWHCHIIDHEDNEMMRPMQVGK